MITQKLFFTPKISASHIDEAYEALREEMKSSKVGYYTLPDGDMVDKIESFIKDKELNTKKLKNVAVIGIGGSSLGTRAVDTLLSHTSDRNDKKLIFLENVDPIEIENNLKNIEFDESIFIVISKSGSTVETISHLKHLIDYFKIDIKSEKFRFRFVTITDENSPLDAFSKEFGLDSFYIPQNVGGRFSVFSAVGLLPLSLLGYDIRKLLEGAKEIRESFFAKNEDLLVQKAHCYVTQSKRAPINVLFSYAGAFNAFNDWYVQLWGESLGKVNEIGEHCGMTPVGLIGSIDQHSFLQLLIEGPRDKTVTMIKVKDFQKDLKIPNISLKYLEKTDFVNGITFNDLINAQCDATMQSIIKQGISVDLIEIKRVEEKSVGYLIFYYELLTSLCGHFLGINTYDQPGVELGKNILKEKFAK